MIGFLLVATALAWERPRIAPLPPRSLPAYQVARLVPPVAGQGGTLALVTGSELPDDRFAVAVVVLGSDRVGAEVGSRAWEAAAGPRLASMGVSLSVAATGSGWRWAAAGPLEALPAVLELERARVEGVPTLDAPALDAAHARWQEHRATSPIDTWGRRLRLVAAQLVDPSHVFADVADGPTSGAAQVAASPPSAIVLAAPGMRLTSLTEELWPLPASTVPAPLSPVAPPGPSWAILDARVARPEVVLAWTVPLGSELWLAHAADLQLGRRLHGVPDVIDRPTCSAVRDVVASAVVCSVPLRSDHRAGAIAARARSAAARRLPRRARDAVETTTLAEHADVFSEMAVGEVAALTWAAWRYAAGHDTSEAIGESRSPERRTARLAPDRAATALLLPTGARALPE